MITPKEKAQELVNKFRDFADGIDSETDRFSPNVERKNAKQCALIAVDEVVAQIEPSVSMDVISARIEYWQQVKQEIENL